MGWKDMGKCPICKQPFYDCKHSLKDVEDFNVEKRIREIVRDEVKQIAKREAEAELRREKKLEEEMGWELMQP
jgi:hypothetical protein